MGKPPNKGNNFGAATVTPTPNGGGRELPSVDVDPATNPEAARLIAGATTASVGAQHPSPATPAASTEVKEAKASTPGGGLIVEKLRVSMTADATASLDEVERIYRRVSGENISSGRVLRAGLRLLAGLSQEDLIKAIEDEPEAAAGRPAR